MLIQKDGTKTGIDSEFPINELDRLAHRESFNKHLYRPNTYLHKWWARRSGVTFRYILKQLSDDPDKRDYYAAGGLENKLILDPMMGGGTTVHEAIRLGASVIGYDLDPIPVLQAKASLTPVPLREKQEIFNKLVSCLQNSLEKLFHTQCPICRANSETQFMLYGLRKICKCGEALVVDSLRVREETNGIYTYIDPCNQQLYRAQTPINIGNKKPYIYDKNVVECPICEAPWKELRELSFTERYRPVLISGKCLQHGAFLKQIDEHDLTQIQLATEYVKDNVNLPVDILGIPEGPKSNDLLKRGIKSYAELFTARQLIYIAECKAFLVSLPEQHRLWLSLLVSTSLEFNSLLCGYKGTDRNRAGAIRHVFSHHAYSFPHTALENNPLFSGNTSGTIGLLFQDRIQNAALWAQNPIERKFHKGSWLKTTIYGESDTGIPGISIDALRATPSTFCVQQQDSSRMHLPDNSVDHVVTDPPYYDSVQYSDLAYFFRVWLRWFLPNSADWDYDVKNSAVAESEQDGEKYQKVMTAIWQECHRVLIKPDGRLIFTFHHWKPEAWAYLTMSLKNAGFRLLAHYVVQSENPISVHIRQLNALKHDAILVLHSTTGFYNTRTFSGKITSKDSYNFCDQCAAFLGYCLDIEADNKQIMKLWQEILGNS